MRTIQVYICSTNVMFRKLVIYFLLAMFSNTMVFPESCFPMQGLVYEHGGSAAEINSLIEFVVESCLQVEDATPLDEEENIPHALKFSKYLDYVSDMIKPDTSFQITYVEIKATAPSMFLLSFVSEVPELPPQLG